MRGFLSKWSNLKTVFTGSTALMSYYRPLLVLTTMIDYHLGQLYPFVYHLSNLIWHVACVVLMFELLLQLKVQLRTAFFMALLFSVHPIMLHAVAWIPGRNDSMLCFFLLASLIALNHYCARKKTKYFIYHLVFFCCALLTKETAIIFPIIYALLVYIRIGTDKKVLGKSIFMSFIILLGWLYLWKKYVSVQELTPSTPLATLQNLALAYLLYIGKIIIPFKQSVTPTLRDATILPGLLTVLIFVGLWWRFKPTDKKLAFFGAMMFILLLFLPVLFIAMKSDGEQYEHRLYAPMLGVFVFLSQLDLRLVLKESHCFIYAQ